MTRALAIFIQVIRVYQRLLTHMRTANRALSWLP